MHPTYYIFLCPEHSQRTALKMEVMMSCADTRSQERNKLGYSSLSNHKFLSFACRLNTLAQRQALIVCMHAREYTQSNATTYTDMKNKKKNIAKDWHMYQQTDRYAQTMQHAKDPLESAVYLICHSIGVPLFCGDFYCFWSFVCIHLTHRHTNRRALTAVT